MKKVLCNGLLLFMSLGLYAQFNLGDIIKSKVPEIGKVLNLFESSGPISTNFDDADFEVELLRDFEPSREAYRALDIQPTEVAGGFRLRSGLYTMKARSFCLKAGTYGPSSGDGHLYAPLKGKKSDFVKTILTRYANKPELSQQKIQVLLWAIIAGADMNNLGSDHLFTLSQLFSVEELLKYKGKDWLTGFADKEINALKSKITGQIPPQLQMVLNANNNLRQLLQQNSTFQQLESIAVLAGIAPVSDMARQVSKGRWSYHSNGYFVRYFPEGYAQTTIDVYVPFEGSIDVNKKGKVTAVRHDVGNVKEVVFNPADMVAVPANRSSQRIGVSAVPITPCNGNAGLGQDISLNWKKKVNEYKAKLQGQSDIRNHGITCAYAKMYMQNPGKFKWAGLAALTSGKIGEHQNDFKLWEYIKSKVGFNEEILFKEDIFKGNQAVFDDLFWQHWAYSEGGIAAIEKLYCNKEITEMGYRAWLKIHEGNVWEGNLALLYHEQKNVLQPKMYAQHGEAWGAWDLMNSIGARFFLGKLIVSTVPDDGGEFPGDNIANFEERWKWIEEYIMPSWERFETNPANKAKLLEALREVCKDCCD